MCIIIMIEARRLEASVQERTILAVTTSARFDCNFDLMDEMKMLIPKETKLFDSTELEISYCSRFSVMIVDEG